MIKRTKINVILLCSVFLLFTGCHKNSPLILEEDAGVDVVGEATETKKPKKTTATTTEHTEEPTTEVVEEPVEEVTTEEETLQNLTPGDKEISFDSTWEFAENSKIHSGKGTYYFQNPENENKKSIVVCINAGHGTKGGEDVKTLCHPDGSPKVTDGTTKKGEVKAIAVSSGTDMKNGKKEAEVNLSLAQILKEKLLKEGYDVLMIREGEDVQLDNVARTLMANACADCHIALHYDGTDTDKGVFFCSVPHQESYRRMYPVCDVYEQSNALGKTIVSAIEKKGFSLYKGGEDEVDLTQTSYSKIPSIDLEVGDEVSDTSRKTQEKIADGIVDGLNQYFE